MTEQPSQEYIDLIKSEEFAWLQEEWEPTVGDWMLVQSSQWSTPIPDRVLLIVEEAGVGIDAASEVRRYFKKYPNGKAYLWLPTLGRLVRLVQQYTWAVEVGIRPTGGCYANTQTGNCWETAALRLLGALRGGKDERATKQNL